MIHPEQAFRNLRVPDMVGDSVRVRWEVPADLAYFEGHFPGNPIFPAVGILDATLHVLNQLLVQTHPPDPAVVPSLPAAKFMSPITPKQNVFIELRPVNEKEWLVEWKDEATSKLLATLRIQL